MGQRFEYRLTVYDNGPMPVAIPSECGGVQVAPRRAWSAYLWEPGNFESVASMGLGTSRQAAIVDAAERFPLE